MIKKTLGITSTAIGALLVAQPAFAQDYYFGGSVGFGNVDTTTTYPFTGSGDITNLAVFGGARFQLNGDRGNGLYAGVELEVFQMSGFGTGVFNEAVDDSLFGAQAEAHLGYSFEKVAVYGFVGTGIASFDGPDIVGTTGPNVYGIGAEFSISDKLALRIEHAISRMHVDGCSNYDVDRQDTSVGIVVNF